MSHATSHALAFILNSHDPITEINLDEIDDNTDALDLATVDLDLDSLDVWHVDPIFYFDNSACDSLDDATFDMFDRY
jgi:hypothetical protein